MLNTLMHLKRKIQMVRASERQDYRKAMQLANLILKHRSDDALALWVMAKWSSYLEDLDGTIQCATRLLKTEEDDFDALKLLATSHYAKGSYNESYNCAKQALSIYKPGGDESMAEASDFSFSRSIASRMDAVNKGIDRSNLEWITWAKDVVRWYEGSGGREEGQPPLDFIARPET